ncbi:STAS domain-containing protein [Streptomyces sp. CA-251247]|uniref:STAS domain-containing protein n=1 Tax=Streptomyces sp. CA-251247 TaxID=3240062 RepID=UPI003D8BE0B3
MIPPTSAPEAAPRRLRGLRGLTITAPDAGAGPVGEIAGDLDYDTAPRLRQAVEGLTLEAGALLVLDLVRLGFCDSSGITAFIVARNRAIAAETEVAWPRSRPTRRGSCASSASTRFSPCTPTQIPPPCRLRFSPTYYKHPLALRPFGVMRTPLPGHHARLTSARPVQSARTA